MVLAGAAELRVDDFNVQGLANTVWAFATLKQSGEDLFLVLARAANRRAGDFHAQNLANSLWALAVANSYSDKLFGHVLANRCEATSCTVGALTLRTHSALTTFHFRWAIAASPPSCCPDCPNIGAAQVR